MIRPNRRCRDNAIKYCRANARRPRIAKFTRKFEHGNIWDAGIPRVLRCVAMKLSDGSIFSKLLALASSGSEDALGQLLHSYRSYLKLLARIPVHNMGSAVDASDIVQEVCLRAYRSFRQFRGTQEIELTAWLRRILANCLIDHHRKHHSQAQRQRDAHSLTQALDQSSLQWSARLVGAGLAPGDQAEQREAMVLLAEAIDRLPADYREAIILRQLEELPTAEVARRMGRTAESVRKLWARGLVQLRQELRGLS